MEIFETEQDVIQHLDALGDLPTEPYIIQISESYLSRLRLARAFRDTVYCVDWNFLSQRVPEDPWAITVGIRNVGLEDLVRGTI